MVKTTVNNKQPEEEGETSNTKGFGIFGFYQIRIGEMRMGFNSRLAILYIFSFPIKTGFLLL